ncbi:MAG TPA: hypothetical protein VK832_14620 [Burkholderiaceae bacterium]|jgi:hypothetical protein|nr:hypothetical protein [Burkholderiaceae bacterium]
MAVIEIVLSEDDHQRLHGEYSKMCETWSRLGHGALPPTFEQWLGVRAAENEEQQSEIELNDMRVFNAIEKLISSLPQQGFALTHYVKQGVLRPESEHNLAQLIVREFRLPMQFAKRLEEVFMHYVKDAKEVADLAQIGVTNRTYGALNEAFRHLLERSTQSVPNLGSDRAIGRVEGAASILVSVDAMKKEAATEKTNAFKQQARGVSKSTWVNKIFGGSNKDE